LAQWEQEFSGFVVSATGSSSGGGLVALCWFEGDIQRDTSVSGGPMNPRFRLLAVQFTGPAASMRSDRISEMPIPVLAPPKPDLSLLPADVPQDQVVHPQPEGVPVVDVLVERPPPPPVDCFVDGCPDDQVEVGYDIRIDDESYNPSAGARVQAGRALSLKVSLRVEAGEQLDDLQIGFRRGDIVGGNEPLALVLFEADRPVVGEESFTLRWDVPAGRNAHNLIIKYSAQPSRTEQRQFAEMGLGKITSE
jgi:hypothetical protein